MTSDQYWQWFLLNMYYSLLFSVPLIFGAVAWAIINWWYEEHQEDKPEQHFTTLFR